MKQWLYIWLVIFPIHLAGFAAIATSSWSVHFSHGQQDSDKFTLKWYYDENRIFPIEVILKHKQEACMRRSMLFTI